LPEEQNNQSVECLISVKETKYFLEIDRALNAVKVKAGAKRVS